jgi:hypothetical protein
MVYCKNCRHFFWMHITGHCEFSKREEIQETQISPPTFRMKHWNPVEKNENNDCQDFAPRRWFDALRLVIVCQHDDSGMP